jgi:hypothetical protein
METERSRSAPSATSRDRLKMPGPRVVCFEARLTTCHLYGRSLLSVATDAAPFCWPMRGSPSAERKAEEPRVALGLKSSMKLYSLREGKARK